MKKLIALLLLSLAGCVHAQSPSGQGSVGGQGSISQQPATVAPLRIVSPDPLPNAQQGVPYLYIMRGSGGTPCLIMFPYNWAVISGNLPPGLFLETISGSISHFSTSLGTYTSTIEVTDCGGQRVDKVFHLTVAAPAVPVITTTSPLPGCIVGSNCSIQFLATGGTAPYTWSQTAGSVPPGCSFPAGGGSDSLVCSPPTTAGTYSFTVVATDSNMLASAPLGASVTISCPTLSISSSPAWPTGTQGQPYSLQLASTGGTGALIWGLTAQPTGLTINSSSGLVSGTPTVSGVFSPAPSVTDSCLPTPSTANQTASLSLNNNGLTLTTSSLASGTVGTPLTIPLSAIGGNPPYTYSNPSSNLPPGLSVSGSTITGTPTTSGSYPNITLRVTDNIAATNDGVSPYSMTVSCPAISITSSPVWPVATKGQPYSLGLTSSGGTGALTWSVPGLPTGLTVNTSTGLVSGTPSVNGNFNPIPFVTDSCLPTGSTASQNASLMVNNNTGPLTLTNTTPLAAQVVGTPATIPLSASGGTPAYTFTNPTSNLPTGLSISGATITGTPTTSGTFSSMTLRVTDSLSAHNDGSSPYAMTVTCPALTITSNAAWPQATKSQSYSLSLTSSGGTGTLTWGATGLPTGLSINTSTGLVSGTPSVSGNFTPVPTVTDSCLPSGTVASQNATLTVNSNALTLTVATPLQAGTINVPLTIPLTAIGGTPPYTYTNPTANLPTGLSISGATITGTPTVAGNYTGITLRVTDNVSATNDGSSPYSELINSAGGDDSRYCPNGTWAGGTSDGVANLPTACNYTPLSATPASGPVKTVCASGCDFTTVQAAVVGAQCGWIIKIKSTSDGTPTGTPLSYQGQFNPATVCGNSNWIWVETDQVSGLPPEGTRISPAWMGVASLPWRPPYNQPSSPGTYVPKLLNNGKVLNCIAGASHWRFIGLAITTVAGTTITGDMNSCIGADHIIFDRIIGWSGNNATWQSTDQVKTFLDVANTTSKSVINSYIGEMHQNGSGSNDFNLGGCASFDEGPTKIVNNFLEAADSFSSVGGCGVGLSTVVMQNMELRRNHIFKTKCWKTNDACYFGTLFTVKDGIDWKNITKALVEGNIIDTTWGQQSDQPGPLVEFGAKNQSSFTTPTVSTNGTAVTATSGLFPPSMTASNCAVANSCKIQIPSGGLAYHVASQADTSHITLTTSAGVQTGVLAKAYAPGVNPNAEVSHITFRYNYLTHGARGIEIFSAPSDGDDIGKFTGNIEVHDNVADDIDPSHWNLSGGACCAWGVSFYISNSFPSPNYLNFLDIHHNTLLPFLTGGGVGDGPSLGFAGQSATTGWIGNFKMYDNISASGFGESTKGVCAAAGQSVLVNLQCWDAINGVAQNTYCFDHNVLATSTATTGSVTGTRHNPPYPGTSGPTASPNCGFVLTGTAQAATYDSILFTNLNGGIGGDYSLQVGSPYHHTASDGTDPGVNWPLLQQYIQGVN